MELFILLADVNELLVLLQILIRLDLTPFSLASERLEVGWDLLKSDVLDSKPTQCVLIDTVVDHSQPLPFLHLALQSKKRSLHFLCIELIPAEDKENGRQSSRLRKTRVSEVDDEIGCNVLRVDLIDATSSVGSISHYEEGAGRLFFFSIGCLFQCLNEIPGIRK